MLHFTLNNVFGNVHTFVFGDIFRFTIGEVRVVICGNVILVDIIG
tara:strand:- start:302 stop:436 length:135 start_codon:yes stop_codon:yes gene_type:complete